MLTPTLNFVSRLRIGPRLVLGFLSVAALCGFLGYRALAALGDIRAAQVNAATNLVPSALNLGKARSGALRVQRAERTLLAAAARKDDKGMAVARGNVTAGLQALDEGAKGYGGLPMTDKEAAMWKDFQAALAEWRRDSEQVMAHADRGEFDRAQDAALRELQTANRMNDALGDLMSLQEQIAKEEEAQASATYASARATLLGTVAGAVVLAAVLGLLLTVSVTRPLARTVAVIEGVAKGDLSRRSDVASKDEIGQLAAALNAAIANTQAASDKSLDYVRQLESVSRAQAVIEFKPDGTVVAANDNFLNVVGYTLSEIVGRHHSTFMDPAEAGGAAYREFWAKLARGEYQAGEFRRVAKGGREVWIHGGYFPIADAAGKVQKVVKFASDITEAKRLEQRGREDAARQQREADELRRKVDAILVSVSAMADGDFTQQIPDLGDDAVGQMAAALNRATVAVRTALEGVREVSEQLADASGQLASASEEISTGAQQQASSLEETASTLEEITATVKQNSDSAQQARQLASGSKEVAEKGGAVVSSAVDAMAEINQSSKKIAEIITAIDEIAFQTNLLALNAAVEAARAGEQGRGFAVVAAEVRNLAQRSATAAKEIKSLISDSVRKVDAGTELVNKSGSTLHEIVTSVKRVTDIITEIAAAGREQSTGIEQVNKAVSQMDAVTQRNASQTEEMSATAQTLTEQAAQLRDLVAQFKLSGGRPAPAAKPAKAPKPATKPRPAVARALQGASNGHANGRVHELDRLGDDDGFTNF